MLNSFLINLSLEVIMEKIYILDTNVLIHDPQSLFSYGKDKVVIPIIVIEEVDNFKKGLDEKGRNARQIGRYLDSIRSQGKISEGVKIHTGGIVQVSISKKVRESSHDVFIKESNDNLIIGTALYFKELNPDKKVILVSKDANVRIKADAVGLIAENYNSHHINFEELYTGIKDIVVPDEEFAKINESNELKNKWDKFYPNQFLRIKNEDSPELDSILLRYCEKNDRFYHLKYYKRNQETFSIKARNDEQICALELLLDPEVRLVSLVGKAGTGKTLLAMAAGLNQVTELETYTRMVVSRPISPLGKDLGFLPGTKAEKFNPWMQPIYDNMEILLSAHEKKEPKKKGKIFDSNQNKQTLEDFLDYGFIELEPLTYIRGRSLPDQYIVIDESQNLTPHEMKTIITRAGEKTKIVLTGDPYQIDIPYLDSESNGLSSAVEKLRQEKIVGHITLVKGERSKLADIAAKYF